MFAVMVLKEKIAQVWLLLPLLSCFFYQDRFCFFDPNYQHDENNNDDDDDDDDDDISITATNPLFQVL